MGHAATGRHALEIRRSAFMPGPEHAEACVYPEHPDERDYSIVCLEPSRCRGWMVCREPHEVGGRSAACGPHSCSCRKGEPNCPGEDGLSALPWYGEEVFEFHGVEHTWRGGAGWTVPYRGCVVAGTDAELPRNIDEVPSGLWAVDEEWLDESDCYLDFTSDPPEPIEPRPSRDAVSSDA